MRDLVSTFGRSPRVLVLDFLLNNSTIDYCKSDIAARTGISRATLELFWNELIKTNIITRTRKIGRAEMYKLNKELPLVQKLMKLTNKKGDKK
ncbi:hypothetical protein HQ529_05010 [Candidatus Woesearchaeota archaeon]|nr:hypothetical protein [Candidatus Woesearchaeota archaeon]